MSHADATGEVTRLLRRYRDGDPAARTDLIHVVYAELRTIADRQLHDQIGAGIQPTELVSEFYLKVADRAIGSAADRRHFLNIAAVAMQGLVVDARRRAGAQKRGGDRVRVDINLGDLVARDASPEHMERVNQALERLRAIDAD